MPQPSLSEEQNADLAAQLERLNKIYTVVGIFWAAWAVAALVGICVHDNVKLPVLGEITFTEVVVYTLYAFTPGIPLLLFLVFRHRKIQKLFAGTKLLPAPRFSKPQDTGMPRIIRTLGFLVFVVLPITAQEIAYHRLWNEVCIAWMPQTWWRVQYYRVVLTHDDLFTFPANPDRRDYANWGFMRLDLRDKGVIDRKKREQNRQDGDGRPERDKGQEPVQILTFPGYAPWAFRISAHGNAALAAWLFATQDGSLPRRVFVWLRLRLRSRTARRSSQSVRPE